MSVPLTLSWYGSPQDQEHGKPRGIGVLWLLAVETEYPSLLEAYGFNEI